MKKECGMRGEKKSTQGKRGKNYEGDNKAQRSKRIKKKKSGVRECKNMKERNKMK